MTALNSPHDRFFKAVNTGLLPAIIPVVFYHGAARWGVKRQFAETVADAPGLQRYVPVCEHPLVDLSAYRDEELRGAVMLQVAVVDAEDSGNKLGGSLVFPVLVC